MTTNRNSNLNKFHEWLKVQTLAGFITRQETVSMIPPVVLNVQPQDKVLDMCAAPGSKTSQMLEAVNIPANEGDTEPTGIVVAKEEVIESLSSMISIIGLANTNVGQAIALPMIENGEILRVSNDLVQPFYRQKSQQAQGWLAETFDDALPYHVHCARARSFFGFGSKACRSRHVNFTSG